MYKSEMHKTEHKKSGNNSGFSGHVARELYIDNGRFHKVVLIYLMVMPGM